MVTGEVSEVHSWNISSLEVVTDRDQGIGLQNLSHRIKPQMLTDLLLLLHQIYRYHTLEDAECKAHNTLLAV